MPPSRKSSSSHSRSRSSRSRSSSRSSRSSSRSRHSRSSHSGRSYSSSRGSYVSSNLSSFNAASFSYKQRKPIRSNTSFPKAQGYRGTRRFYHCYKHDYYYYDTAFVDAYGNSYQPGYYDENGEYYANLDIQDNPATYYCECRYCGTNAFIDPSSMQGDANGMKVVKCNSCGADLDLDQIIPNNVDYKVLTEDCKDYNNSSGSRMSSLQMMTYILIGFFVVTSVMPLIATVFIGGISLLYTFVLDQEEYRYSENTTIEYTVTESNVDIFGDRVYVPEIERYCPWSSAYEAYYDNATECYFWYNNEIDTPQMQYWYEDFSSEYGDYGWLEYDRLEEQWYVEVDDGVWVIVENAPDYFWFTTYESLLDE